MLDGMTSTKEAVEVDRVPRHVKHHHCSSPESQIGTATDDEDKELFIHFPAQDNEREEIDSEEDATEELDRALERRSSRSTGAGVSWVRGVWVVLGAGCHVDGCDISGPEF